MKTFIFFILISCIVNISYSQRKIKDGQTITTTKKYVVYLLKAKQSPREYDAWICGGAIVSPSFIVTSAACVEDVEFMYAIAGYGIYVKAEAVAEDPCANAVRKKVVLSCVPKSYNMSYDKIEMWSYIDIAAVKVESPYDFKQILPVPECSSHPEPEAWVPNKIQINYEAKYQSPGTDSLVLGWGHKSKWRAVNDPTDYNQEFLNYGSTLIQNKTLCKKYYRNLPLLQATIDKYMVCTLAAGNIDDKGEQIVTHKPDADGCTEADKKLGTKGCIEKSKNSPAKKGLPQPIPLSSVYVFDDVAIDMRRAIQNNTHITRRNGICQNDHGGPLITWIGAHEVLIGVASVFRISNHSECIGPYLYTSTQCNGQFLDCVITDLDNGTKTDSSEDDKYRRTQRRDVCNMAPAERGFEIVERRISWKHHPDGPAKNELEEEIFERPQIPLHNYNKRSKSTTPLSTTSQSASGTGDTVPRAAKTATTVSHKP